MPDKFPRSKDIPEQSPLFWVSHKDRYLRQLLIRDIEEVTGRQLIVYFTNCDTNAQIDQGDDVYFAELLRSIGNQPIDLLLETNGGGTDPTEKICSILTHASKDLRVIVPRRAKSNGTVIALCGSTILMGMESELGPIDPSINNIPVEFILNAPAGSYTPLDMQIAKSFHDQTRKLAINLLSNGMMSSLKVADIKIVINKLATRNHYHSHGSVIDATEAKDLGLNITIFDPKDLLWQKIWLLRTMYHYDCVQSKYSKLFESHSISTAVTT